MGFAEAIKGEKFTLLTEVDPPKGVDLKEFVDGVLGIRGRVTAVAVTDGSNAIMRMTPLAPCRALIEHNVEPVMVINGRDRNRISFQGDLLSAWALGVSNVILEQGQDPKVGDQPLAGSSSDLNLDAMLQSVCSLNEGKDLAGETLQGKTDYLVGVALDVSDDINVNRKTAGQIKSLGEQGVGFVVLGPTYDVNIIDLFTKEAEDTGVAVLTSVMMLKSVAMIRYLNNMPGVPSIPHEFLKKMMDAPVKQQAGLEIAANLVREIEQRCKGAVLITLGWGSRLPEFLNLLGR